MNNSYPRICIWGDDTFNMIKQRIKKITIRIHFLLIYPNHFAKYDDPWNKIKNKQNINKYDDPWNKIKKISNT